MSKFVKVSDVKQTLLEMSKEKTRSVGWGDVLMERLKDHSIEVSEDCISREGLLKSFGLSEKTRKYGGDHSGYNTMMLYEIQDYIEDAPSVVPKQSELTEAYIRGYKDGAERNLETKLKALQEAVETFT